MEDQPYYMISSAIRPLIMLCSDIWYYKLNENVIVLNLNSLCDGLGAISGIKMLSSILKFFLVKYLIQPYWIYADFSFLAGLC